MRWSGTALPWVAFAAALVQRHGDAAAATWGDWKDGCPAYFSPEQFSPDPPPDNLPVHDGAAAFGSSPELDSSLAPTRLALGSVYGKLADRDEKPALLTGQAVVQLNFSAGPLLMVSAAIAGGNAAYDHVGNLQFYVGYRRARYLLGDAFRTGSAIRFGGGNSPIDANGDPGNPRTQPNLDERHQIAVRSPFRTQLFGYDRPLTLTLEHRIEMVGCHAPFVHLRVDLSTWRMQTQTADELAAGVAFHPRVLVVPMTIAVGGYIKSWIASFMQVGIELRTPKPLMSYGHLTRVGGGFEVNLPYGLRVGVRGNVISGDTSGVEMGLWLIRDSSWWKGVLQ